MLHSTITPVYMKERNLLLIDLLMIKFVYTDYVSNNFVISVVFLTLAVHTAFIISPSFYASVDYTIIIYKVTRKVENIIKIYKVIQRASLNTFN